MTLHDALNAIIDDGIEVARTESAQVLGLSGLLVDAS